MNTQSICTIIDKARQAGVTRLSYGDLYICFEHRTPDAAPASVSALPVVPEQRLEPESEDPIRHKTEQLASLLKLSDSELVDQLFPVEESVDRAWENKS